MFSLLFKSIKFVFFASAILLVGQVSVGKSDTVGSLLEVQVKKVWQWGSNELNRSRWFSGWVTTASLGDWWRGRKPRASVVENPTKQHRVTSNESSDSTVGEEEYTASDRESILRLLQ